MNSSNETLKNSVLQNRNLIINTLNNIRIDTQTLDIIAQTIDFQSAKTNLGDITTKNIYLSGNIYKNGELFSVSGSSAQWTNEGSDISFTTGNVIIGNLSSINTKFMGTVTGITKAMVGLGNVDNTSDLDKPISVAQQSALDLKAPLESPVFSGNIIIDNLTSTHGIFTNSLYGITVANTNNSNHVATTAYVKNIIGDLINSAPQSLDTLKEIADALGNDNNLSGTLTTYIALKAPIESPAFTGTVSGITKGMIGLENVDNTNDANKPISTAQQSALDLKANINNSNFTGVSTVNDLIVSLNANVIGNISTSNINLSGHIYINGVLQTGSQWTNEETDISFTTGNVIIGNLLAVNANFMGTVTGITKGMVGLENVDNTSDANKPISTDQQSALDLKAPLESPNFTGTVGGITKGMIGLENVDNTSDSNKPISTAQQSALDQKANINSSNFTGVSTVNDLIVSLNANVIGNISTSNINLSGHIYINGVLQTGSQWTNEETDISFTTGNVIIGNLLAVNANFMGTVTGITKGMVGLANVDNTSDANKPVSTAQQSALDLKAPLESPNFTGTVGGITNGMIGLGNVDNTSDANKPISTAQQSALDLKAPLESPAFTGIVTGITRGMIGLANVDNTSDANKPVSTAQQSALDLKAPLESPNFTGIVTGITKGIVGLGNVDNTSDANKPISTAQQSALNLKAPLESPTFTGTVTGISKSMVGLANVDNTSDANKPISTAQQSALNLKAPLESPTFTGTVIGITKSMVDLGNVDNTSDANKPVSTAQQSALNLKAPLESPTFTGTVIGITKSMVDLANVDNTSDANKPVSTAQQSALNLKANKASPTFTGNVGIGSSQLFSTKIFSSWQQIGSDIDGESNYNNGGWSVSFSANGNTLAIGAAANDSNGINSGHVRVYDWNSTEWVKRGQDIDGEADWDNTGHSVSISADGNTVAIGAPYNDGNDSNSGHVRVYDWNSNAWVKRGEDIDGEAAEDYSGYSVSISANGNIVAIGAFGNDQNGSNRGHVRVYYWNSTAWVKRGEDIDGEAISDESGFSVSIAADGNTVAIGARYNGNGSGHVRVYDWNSNAWVKRGQDIDGEAEWDNSGSSVSISADGNTVAIGAKDNDGNGNASGHVRVYDWNSNAWVKRGQDIDGEAADDYSGRSVSISADGNTVAIGASNNAGNGNNSGHVRVYDWNSTAWIKRGLDIDGEAISDESGFSVSLSADGNTVAIGAWLNDGNGSDSGHVRVYRSDVNSILSIPDVKFTGNVIGITKSMVDLGNVDNTSDANKPISTAQQSALDLKAYIDNSNLTGISTVNDLIVSLNANVIGNISTSNINITGDIFKNGTLFAGSQWTNIVSDISYTSGNVLIGNLSAVNANFIGLSTVNDIIVSRNADIIKNATIGGNLNTNGNTTLSGILKINKGYIETSFFFTKIGNDIEGEANEDLSGSSVSLSSDGTILAVGANWNDDNGDKSGHVRVHKWNGTSWIQQGNDIAGEAAGDESGYSVSISSDGNILAVGAIFNDGSGNASGHVRVYNWDGTSWTQRGNDIDGQGAGDKCGWDISLSGNGNILAVASPFGNSVVRVFEWSNNTWTQIGGGISPSVSASISYQGSILATGGNNTVVIWNWDGTSWSPLGNAISGEEVNDQSGNSISLSHDGKTVAIGAALNNGNGNQSGHVRIYKWNESSWVKLGNDIDGEGQGDFSGYDVSISGDGTIVAIGAYANGDDDVGHVRLYKWNGISWIQYGNDIDGYPNEYSGYSVSLSSNGNIVAIGSGLVGTGRAKVFQINPQVTVFPNITTIDGELNVTGNMILANANIMNNAKISGTLNVLGNTIFSGFVTGITTGNVIVSNILVNESAYILNNTNINGILSVAGNTSLSGVINSYNYKILSSGYSIKLGDDIIGEANGDNSGHSVSISADGTILAIGAPLNNGNGDYSGHARVYKYNKNKISANSLGPAGWDKLGGDIDGEASDDQFGSSVSLSSDGTILAVSAKWNDANGINKGHARVYKYNQNKISANSLGPAGWDKLGDDIDGEYDGDVSGNSVSLSSDGTIIAIGAYVNDGNGTDSGHVRVYKYKSNKSTSDSLGPAGWDRLGGDIDGEAAGDSSGFSISLSANGTIIAIGAIGNNGYKGHVRIYKYNDNKISANSLGPAGWDRLGGDIDGEVDSDMTGTSVSLSSDGTIVAIGGIFNDSNGNDSGQVRVYKYNQNKVSSNNLGPAGWDKLGGDINGSAPEDRSGNSVSLSADGSILAIGASFNDSNGTNSGQVTIYKYNQSKITANSLGPAGWDRLGGHIDGEATGDLCGGSVILSADGTIVAIGAVNNEQKGHVRVYSTDFFKSLVISADTTLSKNVNISGNVTITSNSISTSNLTGAFVVSGGIGIKANSYFGENVTIDKTCTVNTLNQLSDYRLKSNVVNIPDEINIDNLRPVEYTNNKNNLRQYGFIAHEVAECIPYITNGEKDHSEYQSINYLNIIPILVKELQNAKKEIAILKSKII
jgi:hypothetical protein